MPSASKAQFKLMEIASYNKEFAEARGMDQDKAREWHKEDMKKKKDDPEWFEKLPEKAEGKDKKKKKKSKSSNEAASASFEGMFDKLSKLFGKKPPTASSTSAPVTRDEYSEVLSNYKLYKVAEDPRMKEKVILNTGVIKVRDIAAKFHLKQWNANWLSQLETTVKSYSTQVGGYLKRRKDYSVAMERIYTACKSMSPMEALTYAQDKTEVEKKKLGLPPRFNFPNTTLEVTPKPNGSFSYTFNDRNLPETMPVPDHETIKKIISLIYTTFSLTMHDEDDAEWSLEGVDEYEYWARKYPNDDKYYAALLDLFPMDGDFYEFSIRSVIYNYAWQIEEGLVYLLGRSVKEVSEDLRK